jgi:hypothetical protein
MDRPPTPADPGPGNGEQDRAGVEPLAEDQPHVVVELELDDQSGVLSAVVSPSAVPTDIDLDWLTQRIREGGYGDYSFEAQALPRLLRHVAAREHGVYPLARRFDAEVTVTITADRMRGLLTTTRAYGGAPVTEARLREAIAAAGIAEESVLEDAIAAALAQPSVTHHVIAQGVAPRAGTDSRVELLVDLTREAAAPKEDERGRVDHYLLREFVIVDPGTPLLRRHPATLGVAGRDVCGEIVPARDGRDVPLPKEMPGVVPSSAEPDVLVAEYKGHPVEIPGGIRVDKTLALDHVDLRTGNVDFDGSVVVKGDVAAGVVVKATGDVVIQGTVELASVEAGHDLAVSGGIAGPEHGRGAADRRLTVRAGGDVHAAFISASRVRAGGSVSVREYLTHCDTLARGRVLAGQNGGRGLIVGGTCHACQGVVANQAGTPVNVATRIGIGIHPELSDEHDQAVAEAAAHRERLEGLQQARGALAGEAEQPGASQELRSRLLKLTRTESEMERHSVALARKVEVLEAELEATQRARATIKKAIYPGVVLTCADATLAIRSEGPGGRFSLRGEQIAWE